MSIGFIIVAVILCILCLLWIWFGGDIVRHVWHKIKGNKNNENSNGKNINPAVRVTNQAISNNTSETDNMQYCIYCGAKIPEGSQYCMKCGKTLPKNK